MTTSQIIGRMSKSPVLHTSSHGNPCLHFTLRSYRKAIAENRPPRYDLIPCVAWGDLAKEIADKVKEDAVLYVSGKLESRFVDRHDGSPKKFILELRVGEYEVLAS